MSSFITERLNTQKPPVDISPNPSETEQGYEAVAPPEVVHEMGAQALETAGVVAPESGLGYVPRLEEEGFLPDRIATQKNTEELREFDGSRSVGETVNVVKLKVGEFIEEVEGGTTKSLQNLWDAQNALAVAMRAGNAEISARAENLSAALQALDSQLNGQDEARVVQKREVDALAEEIRDYVAEARQKDLASEELLDSTQAELDFLTGLSTTLEAMDIHNTDVDVAAKAKAVELAVEELDKYARGEYIDDRSKLTEYLANSIGAMKGVTDGRQRALKSLREQIGDHSGSQEAKPVVSTITSRLGGL
jgi:hypothetical protein